MVCVGWVGSHVVLVWAGMWLYGLCNQTMTVFAFPSCLLTEYTCLSQFSMNRVQCLIYRASIVKFLTEKL